MLSSRLDEETDTVVAAYRIISLFSSSYTVSPSVLPFSQSQLTIMCPSLLLAIYAIVYATCVWILIRRKREGYMWHVVSSTISFSLASLQVALLVVIMIQVMKFKNIVYNYNEPVVINAYDKKNPMLATQMAFNTIIFLSL